MSKKTQTQLTPDGKLTVQEPIRMTTTTTTSVATPQPPEEQLPESEVADYWEELNGKRQRSHDDGDAHWFPEEAPTSRKRWEELPESTTRKSSDPSEEQVMIDLYRRLSGSRRDQFWIYCLRDGANSIRRCWSGSGKLTNFNFFPRCYKTK